MREMGKIIFHLIIICILINRKRYVQNYLYPYPTEEICVKRVCELSLPGRMSVFDGTKYKQGFYSNVLQQVNGLKNIQYVSSLIRSKLVTVLSLKGRSDDFRLKVLTTYNKEKCYKKYTVTISSKIYKH